MMSESLITKETSLPDIRLENNDFEKIRVGPYATNTKLILVDLVEDDEERSSTNWSSNVDNAI